MKTNEEIDVESLAIIGMDAFWEAVARRSPNTTGDLSPGEDARFRAACRAVLHAWIEDNAPTGAPK